MRSLDREHVLRLGGLGEFVVAREIVDAAIVRVDVLAGADRLRVAKPMIWPNFRTGAPAAISLVAILWPFGTRLIAVTPSATAPGRIGSIETIRLSSGWSRRTRGFAARSVRRMGVTGSSGIGGHGAGFFSSGMAILHP